MSDLGSEIAHFYRGRSVFITGASGFIGKVLLEKLLRSCPEVAQIYVLLRPKKGHDVNKRLKTLVNAQLFDSIRESTPDLLKKVSLISGDITLPNLGISETDATLLHENVSIIFHVAATVRFDEPLKVAALMNITGTKSVAQLAKKVKNLAAVIHVSTAYAHCDRKVIEEVLYPSPINPEKFMSWLDWADESLINEITPVILGKRPNTYTYTKALAETAFADECAHLPAAIIRPSIVASSRKEPFPGWVDNLNGPAGMVAGVGKGVIRTVLGNPKSISAFIPVDVLVNAMIAVAWKTATYRTNEASLAVYNCTGTLENPMRWEYLEDLMKLNVYKKPFKEVVWYPGGSITKYQSYHKFRVFAYHYLPAYVIDAAAVIFGKKPQMVNINRKIWRGIDTLAFFINNEWLFPSDKTKELFRQLSPKDQELFNFDMTNINWTEYLDNFYVGVKTYIIKDPSDSKVTNIHKMYIIKRILDFTLYAVLLRFFWIWTPSACRRLFYPLLDFSLQVFRFLNVNTH